MVGTPHEDVSGAWEREGSVVAGAEPMAFGPPIHVTHLCLQDLLRSNLYISFPLDNGGLLCTPNFMVWWVRWSVHGGSSGHVAI